MVSPSLWDYYAPQGKRQVRPICSKPGVYVVIQVLQLTEVRLSYSSIRYMVRKPKYDVINLSSKVRLTTIVFNLHISDLDCI